MGAPVFLLPAGVAGSAVDELVQPGRVLHAIIQREIVLKAAVIFPGCFAVGDALWAQICNILHSVKGGCIENMGRLAAAVAGNAIRGLLKSAGFQRIGVIPEGGQAQLGLPLLLFLFFLRRFWPGEGIVVAPVLRIVLQRTQPLEGLFIGTISDLAEQFVGVLLKVQQIIHIHQHFLGLPVLGVFQILLEGIEGADTVRISFCLSKLLLEFNILLQVFVHGQNLPSIPPEVPDGGLFLGNASPLIKSVGRVLHGPEESHYIHLL